MVEVIPAIMPKDFNDLAEKVSRVSKYVKSIQLDPMDGRFASEKTWPYTSYTDKDFAELISQEKGFPEWDNIDYEVDLMSINADSDAFDWIKAGAKRIILHFESSEDPGKLIAEIKNEHGSFKDNPLSPEIGIAALNDTPLSEWQGLVGEVDFVQCMGIARIGYQGEPFDERVITLIKTLREKHPELIISVDGGVNGDTAPRLVKAGTKRLVSGSFIFKSQNIKETIENLSRLG